ncbi:MAG: type VI secretion system ImpA family N-terminal domain-containing protein [Planctomycetia bacterium]|nr:type VI secretion system ImpA family N-terminal domain-containing protein [Planctomycetia bacterium]
MSAPETIPLAELVAPISGDFPAGVKLPPLEREKLDKLRKEHNPEDYDEDDPLRHEPRQVANWSGITELAQRLLKTTTKDMNVAARLVEALTKQHGLAGTRDGFRLLHQLCVEAWDRFHPAPELADLDEAESKLRDFRWLDDPESETKGARFPVTLRAVTLAKHGDTIISVNNCRPPGNRPPTVNADQLKFVSAALSVGTRNELVMTVQECLDALESLLKTAHEKMKASLVKLGLPEDRAEKTAMEMVPAFTATRKVLSDCQMIAEQMVKMGPAEDVAAEGSDATATGGTVSMQSAGANREQLYVQLKNIADALEKVEPHSPVPFLIRRAVELRTLKFPRLVEVLTSGTHVLEFMKREVEENPPTS